MAIREFAFTGVARARIAFFKTLPGEGDLMRFRERRFVCGACTEADLLDADYVSRLDAIIFSQDPYEQSALTAVWRDTLPALLNHGVRVYVRIAPDFDQNTTARKLVIEALVPLRVPLANITPAEREQIPPELREREHSALAPYVYIFDSGVDWVTIAHLVCDHPAGNAANRLLKVDGVVLSNLAASDTEERLLLLQRAFSDCRTVHLQPMVDGLSGAPVFKAYASMNHGLAGDWPYLHFVKVGPRKKIVDEYDKYMGRALDYIPFHLGPRLRLDRCNLGATLGILVGDFVEGAEPIRDCAPAGRAGHAIANLFDRTLGAWRKQARRHSTRTLQQYLTDKWLDEAGAELRLPSHRAGRVLDLRGDPDVAPLRSIFDRHAHGEVLTGPAHGDLHATNVLIRGGDAIIIDFEKVEDDFPLLYDPASLEGGLLTESLAHDPRATKAPDELLAAISPLYELEQLRKFVIHCNATNPLGWFYDCLAQIRSLSRHAATSAEQYAAVLAVCLIRKGCNTHAFPQANENLRAISFVLGQRILTQLDQLPAGQSFTNTRQPGKPA